MLNKETHIRSHIHKERETHLSSRVSMVSFTRRHLRPSITEHLVRLIRHCALHPTPQHTTRYHTAGRADKARGKIRGDVHPLKTMRRKLSLSQIFSLMQVAHKRGNTNKRVDRKSSKKCGVIFSLPSPAGRPCVVRQRHLYKSYKSVTPALPANQLVRFGLGCTVHCSSFHLPHLFPLGSLMGTATRLAFPFIAPGV